MYVSRLDVSRLSPSRLGSIKEVEGYEVSGTGTGNVEQWLIKVERSMQETMQKQMQYAVKSFATRALDEWVLDYPQ